MSYLPKSTRMGELEYVDIFDQYDDRPCLFSCRNQNGQTYLAVWVDEADDYDRWLCTAISPTRYKWLKEGFVDVRIVFTEAVSGYVYHVKTDKNGVSNAKMLACRDLTDDILPVTGEALKYN